MPLDRIFRHLIAWQRADGPPVPLRDLTVEQARERYRANALRPGGGPDGRHAVDGPLGAVAAEDRTIETGHGPAVRCRLYRPGTHERRVVTFLHGGGWVAGDLDTHEGLCRLLAASLGAVVVSVDYRRAPEFPYPAALEDAVAAARWTGRAFPGHDHVIAGDSAGAQLAVGVALSARDTGDLPLAAQLLLYPPVDPSLRFAAAGEHPEGHLLSVEDMAWYYGLYVPDPRRRADPALDLLHADLRNLPPAVVGTAEFDPLHDEGVELADKLAVCDVPVRHVPGPGLVHGYFLMQDLVPAAAACAQRVLTELAALLAQPTTSAGAAGVRAAHSG